MNTSILNGKKIAILGGMGSRGEARDALIADLGLAELHWVYSERNKVKEYIIFLDSVYEGKYDYIFILTKFISHKVWDHIKKSDLSNIPLIRVNGSYNAEGFLRALVEQLPIEAESSQNEPVAKPAVIKRLLTPAQVDNSDTIAQLFHEDLIDGDNIADKVNAVDESKLFDKIRILEAQVRKLEANQQDPFVLYSATRFYNAFVDFVETFPIPPDLAEAKGALFKSLQKHGMDVKENRPLRAENQDADIMLTNIVVSRLLTSTMETIRFFSQDLVTDKHGACIVCKRHKSIGCREGCLHYQINQIYGHIKKGIKIAKAPNIKDVAEFLPKRVQEFK